MDITIDKKVQKVALKLIEQSSMDVSKWKYTIINSIHTNIQQYVKLDTGELPIISISISDTNWSVYTTRRILGVYEGNELQIPTSTEINGGFGNFKDLKRDTGTATYIHKDELVSLKYETGKASMAPINYIKFWNLKYPLLDILKE